MRVGFLGSGEIGLPALRWLANPIQSNCQLVGLVTQPDRPAGRGKETHPGPLKIFALQQGLPVLQPARLRTPEALHQLALWSPDLLVVMAYGQILSREVLALPPLGVINLHASLLPRHRGASPIQAALLAGDSQSGITVMHVAPELDAGDMILKEIIPLAPAETGGSLHDKLAQAAVPALARALPLLAHGTAPRLPQDPALVTYAGKLSKDSGRVDWQLPASQLARQIRAFHPWPGSFTFLPHHPNPLLLKILRARVAESSAPSPPASAPGSVCPAPTGQLLVQCGEGRLEIEEAQLEGRRRLPAAEFLRGFPLPPGTLLT